MTARKTAAKAPVKKTAAPRTRKVAAKTAKKTTPTARKAAANNVVDTIDNLTQVNAEERYMTDPVNNPAPHNTPPAPSHVEIDPDVTGMVDTDFYNQHEGVEGRMPGVYLDGVERYNAEVRRASAEGREPDFDNMGSTAGTPLVTPDQLAQPLPRNGQVHDDDVPVTVEPYVTLPVDKTP